MNAISSTALSGMQAAQDQLQAAAHNLANQQTPGFQRQEAVQRERPGGGVSTTVQRTERSGPALEADVVAQLQAKNAFLANLAVFKTGNALSGALLDTQA